MIFSEWSRTNTLHDSATQPKKHEHTHATHKSNEFNDGSSQNMSLSLLYQNHDAVTLPPPLQAVIWLGRLEGLWADQIVAKRKCGSCARGHPLEVIPTLLLLVRDATMSGPKSRPFKKPFKKPLKNHLKMIRPLKNHLKICFLNGTI